MKNKQLTEKATAVFANELIPQLRRYTLMERRLIYFCVAHYDSRSPENPMYEASIREFAALFQISPTSVYTQVKGAMDSLNSKPLRVAHEWRGKPGERDIYWFSERSYIHGEGHFRFGLTHSIAPYLLDLQKLFTPIGLQAIVNFKTEKAWALYEHLKLNLFRSTWSVTVQELRDILDIREDQYKRWNSFRQSALDVCVREVNDHSDLTISYSCKRRGRSVIGVTLTVTEKKKTVLENSPNTLYDQLLAQGLAEQPALRYHDLAEQQGLEELLQAKLPEIQKRWVEKDSEYKRAVPLPRYISAALKDELNIPDDEPLEDARHAQAQACWLEKKRAKKICKVLMGTKWTDAPICQYCKEKFSVLI